MRLLLSLFGLFLLMGAPGLRALDTVPEAGAAAQAVITGQIEALRRDDGATAYAFAAPEVQLKFPTIDIFMSMVKSGYKPVYKPKAYSFAAFESAPGGLRQRVDITAEDGSEWIAEYTLRPDEKGELRITGCRLLKREGVGA